MKRAFASLSPHWLAAWYVDGWEAFCARETAGGARVLPARLRQYPARICPGRLGCGPRDFGRPGSRYIAIERRLEDRKDICPRYTLAHLDMLLGDRDRALQNLERAADNHEMQVLYMKFDPLLAALKDEARMIALLRRIGL